MAYAAFALVVLFLVLTLSALITGVVTPTGPRTLAEKEIATSETLVLSGHASAVQWGQYIAALTANGDYGRARNALAQARASVDDSNTAEFVVAEARLNLAQKKYQVAADAAVAGRKKIKDAYDARIAAGGDIAKKAKQNGINDNYYLLALLAADGYRGLGQWQKAIEQFDAYLAKYPTASDILVDRASVKVEAGDKAGAEKDYRQALKFVPDDPEALAGLKKIGVTP
jgi:tetratricopeptide (TPR) repeat protein